MSSVQFVIVMKSAPILLTILLPWSNVAVHTPGTPGAPWTAEEVLTVKAKLWRIFSGNEAEKMVVEGTPASPEPNADIYIESKGSLFTIAPKALRQGFHYCLRYSDGSGG